GGRASPKSTARVNSGGGGGGQSSTQPLARRPTLQGTGTLHGSSWRGSALGFEEASSESKVCPKANLRSGTRSACSQILSGRPDGNNDHSKSRTGPPLP